MVRIDWELGIISIIVSIDIKRVVIVDSDGVADMEYRWRVVAYHYLLEDLMEALDL